MSRQFIITPAGVEPVRCGRGMPSPLQDRIETTFVVSIGVESNHGCRGRACPSRHRVVTGRAAFPPTTVVRNADRRGRVVLVGESHAAPVARDAHGVVLFIGQVNT